MEKNKKLRLLVTANCHNMFPMVKTSDEFQNYGLMTNGNNG